VAGTAQVTSSGLCLRGGMSTRGEDERPTINATEVGEDGQRVVFLHGLFGQGRNFTQIAKALTPELRSVLVDLPNHGKSAWTESTDYEQVSETVADWLRESYGGDSVHVVGHSMGGKVAMVLALRHPELVDRLVVVDIAPVDNEGSDEFEHLLDSLADLDIESFERRSDADEQLAARVDDDRVRGFLLQNLRSGSDGMHWLANLDLLRRELDTIGGFPDIDATFERPVMWVAGERSPYTKAEHEPMMRQLFPLTRTVTIKEAGHWVHSEKAEEFVTALRVFLLGSESADG
jgi:pimeloyl-ACP methyl ester carboxylesterase